MNKTIGMVLIALGLLGLARGGFTYTTREKIVDIGPIHALAKRHIMCRYLPSKAQWRSWAALRSW